MVSFSDGLAIAGFILALVLVVLDKAGKLKGPLLHILLGVACLLCLPLLLSLPFVVSAVGLQLRIYQALAVALVFLIYVGLRLWSRPEVVCPIKITGFSLEPLTTGSLVSIIVHFRNDSNKTVKVVSKNTSMWVGKLPAETDAGSVAKIEDGVWNHLLTSTTSEHESASAMPVELSAPPGVDLHARDVSSFIVNDVLIDRLNDNSAVYFAGTFAVENGKAETPFCVRVDKHRSKGLTLCRGHN